MHHRELFTSIENLFNLPLPHVNRAWDEAGYADIPPNIHMLFASSIITEALVSWGEFPLQPETLVLTATTPVATVVV